MYMRKICYLDYLENNVRVGNAGYVKFCLHDGRLALEMRIKGLVQTADGWANVMMVRAETARKDAGKIGVMDECADTGNLSAGNEQTEGVVAAIEIRGGCGSFRGEFDADNVDGKNNGFLRFGGLRIILPDGGVLWTDFGYERKGVSRAASLETGLEKTVQTPAKKSTVIKQENAQKGFVSEWIPDALDERLSVDKWEQLCRNYRQLHPFGDKTYISLAPKDFVILRKEYQQLVNNSFLLHGFYNYRHLILGKEAVKEGEIYYLGVPGTYYDREKMVAVMFGFEGFEASGNTQKQPEDMGAETVPGTFGYYMKRVEI